MSHRYGHRSASAGWPADAKGGLISVTLRRFPRPLEPGEPRRATVTDLGFTRDRHINVPKSAIADLGCRSSFEGRTQPGVRTLRLPWRPLRMTVIGRVLPPYALLR